MTDIRTADAALTMTATRTGYQEARTLYYPRYNYTGKPVAATRATYRGGELVETTQGAYKLKDGVYYWEPGGDIPRAFYIAGGRGTRVCVDSNTIPFDVDAVGRGLWNKLARAGTVVLIPSERENEAENLQKKVDAEGVSIVLLTIGGEIVDLKELRDYWNAAARDIVSARIGVKNAGFPSFVMLDDNETSIKETAAALHDAGVPSIIGAPLKYDARSFIEWIDPDRNPLARLYDDKGEVLTDEERLHAAESRLMEKQKEVDLLQTEKEVKRADEWGAPVGDIPRPFKDAAVAAAAKLNVPERTAAAVFVCVFGSFVGHEKATIERPGGGQELAPYLGAVLVGNSGAGKSPLMRMAAKKLFEFGSNEGARANEERRNSRPLKIELDGAQKELARLQAVTRAADNPTDKAKAKEAEEKARRRYYEVAQEHSRANAPARSFLVNYKSAAGVKEDLSRNAAAGRALNEPNNGAVIWLDEGARIFGVTQKPDYTLDVLSELSTVFDVTTNTGTTTTRESPADKYGAAKIGAGFIAGIQTTVCTCWRYPSLIGQGFLNRLFWLFIPYSEKATSQDDISAALESYYALFSMARDISPVGVIELDVAARAVYESWRAGKLQTNRNEANRQGNETKSAFLAKLDEIALRLALVFHLATELDEGRAGMPRQLVDAETMKQAVGFCSVIAEEREKTLRQIALARGESNEADELAQTHNGLSTPARKVYETLDRLGGWRKVTDINVSLRVFRNETKRAVILQELESAGLLIVGKWEQKNKLHAVKPRQESTAADNSTDNPNNGADVGAVNYNEVPF